MDFLIMNRDTVVAEWIDNKLNLIKPSLASNVFETYKQCSEVA